MPNDIRETIDAIKKRIKEYLRPYLTNEVNNAIQQLINNQLKSGEIIKDLCLIGEFGLNGRAVAAFTANEMFIISVDKKSAPMIKNTFQIKDIRYIQINGFPYYQTNIYYKGDQIYVDSNVNLDIFQKAITNHVEGYFTYHSYNEALENIIKSRKDVKKASETKYTCNSCGNIWCLSNEDAASGQNNCCSGCGCWGSRASIGSTKYAVLTNPSNCPKCNSSNIKKEIVAFEINT